MRFVGIGLAIAAVVLLVPDVAHAAGAGGGTMPWNTALQTVVNSFVGSTAYLLGMVALFVCAGVLMFGGEISHFVKHLCFAVLAIALMCNIPNAMAAIGIAGAVIPMPVPALMVAP